jgi:hypothetical protein
VAEMLKDKVIDSICHKAIVSHTEI